MTAAALERRPPLILPPEMVEQAKGQLFTALAQGLSTEEVSLEEYFKQCWPIIEPATTLVDSWYLGYVAEHLEAVAIGQIQRLAISVHPRSLKSNLGTICFPTWDWTLRAHRRFMFASYSRELSTEHSLKRRRLIESAFYQEKWGPIFQLRADQNRKDVFENTATGTMIATSAGGTATGRGADILIFDDFINPKEAESEAERKSAIESYESTFSNRLNDPKRGAMIVLAQRTHREDLTGHVLKEGGWMHLELPVIAQKHVEYSFPHSGRVHVTEPGDILNPERHTSETLGAQKRASGSRGWGAQWLCAPAKDDASMCPKAWWRFYRDEPRDIFARAHVRAQSWDFAFKDLETSSFVAGYAIARIGANKYICAERRDHLDLVATCNAVKAMDSQWPGCQFKFYEDRANGPAVKSTLTSKISGLIPVEPLGSKTARFAAAAPDIESGNVLLPYPWDRDGQVLKDRQWVIDLMDEVEKFPEEPNDRGDALSQGIVKLNNVIIHDGNESEEAGSILMNGDTGDNELDPISFNDGLMNFGGDDGTL